MGKKDTCAWEFYSDSARYADIVNGLICGGEQVVDKDGLHELDSRIGQKSRDLLREVTFGDNSIVIGIENQNYIDYSMIRRTLSYEAGEYERQTAKVQAEVKAQSSGLTSDEYLGRFRKNSLLHPHTTMTLYYGKEPWDAKEELHGIINFKNIPESIRKTIQNYGMRVVDVRRLEDTSVFRTDVRQVFDFIRCADDRKKLEELVWNDPAYWELDKTAYEFMSYYGNAHSLRECREYKEKGKVINMCKALDEIYEDGREAEKKNTILNALSMNLPLEQIMNLCSCSAEYVERVRLCI